MIQETVGIKIYGGKIRHVWTNLRSSGRISFESYIDGRKFKEIEDGNNMKVFYPNGTNERIKTPSGEREDYIDFKLDDGSRVHIKPDYFTQNIIFDFKVVGGAKELTSIRETVLNFIDYDYGS